jgi:hypothetical protein
MLTGLTAPLRVVVQRSLADWLIVAATWLVVLLATSLVAVGVLYGDAVALTGLRRILADAPPTETSIVVELRWSPEDLETLQEATDRQVGRILGWTGGELDTIAHGDSFALPDAPSTELTDLAELASYEKIDRHATLLEGAWPASGHEPMQTAVSRAVADQLSLSTGDTLTISNQRASGGPLDIEVSGIWQPDDRADPYWNAEPLELDGMTTSASFATHGPFVVAPEDLFSRGAIGNVTFEFRALPDFDRLAVDDVAWMRSDTAALPRRLTQELGDDAFFQVDTKLDDILGAANRSLLVSRSGVVVLTIQFAVLAGYALLLVAGLLFDQRRMETALLRSRGAGGGQVILFAFLEALVLVVPAVLLAPWLGIGVLNLLNLAGPLAEAGVRIAPSVDTTVLLATGLAGVAAILGLVVPSLGAGRGLAEVRQTVARQANRTLAQRLGLDVALVVLAAVGIWQLRQYGAPITESVRGSVGLDPLLVAAPALGLIAGSIVALRLVPLAAELAERLLQRRAGLVAPLGARQLARRPLRYTRSALLLMLAAALGTFAGAYGSTWTRSQADQAAHRVGMDVRLVVSGFPDLPDWALGSAYRAVDGVRAAEPVSRERFDFDPTGGGTVLGIDAAAADAIAFRPDLADQPIGELMARLPVPQATEGGLELPTDAVAVTFDVNATLATVQRDESTPTFSPGFLGVLPVALVRDADGLVQRLTGPRLGVGLGAQVATIPLATDGGTPSAPLALIGVGVEVQLPEDTLGAGAVTLASVELSTADGGRETLPIDSPEPISASEAEPIGGLGFVPSAALDASVGGARVDPDLPIPALASARYLELTGASVGDVVDLGGLNQRRAYQIVGSVRAFPTLGTGDAFVVVDLPTLAAVAAVGDAAPLEADEWWMATDPGAGPAVAERLRQEPYSAASVIDVDDLTRDLTTDPIALGLIGALVLGSLSAVAFAGIGFLVSAVTSARERLGEFALLQAIGLSHRQLSAWLTIESAFLVAMGLLVGTGLGLVLAWVVLPFVSLTQDASVPVPPVEVVIPWAAYALLYLVAAAALGVTVLAISSLLARVRVSGVLRSGAE